MSNGKKIALVAALVVVVALYYLYRRGKAAKAQKLDSVDANGSVSDITRLETIDWGPTGGAAIDPEGVFAGLSTLTNPLAIPDLSSIANHPDIIALNHSLGLN